MEDTVNVFLCRDGRDIQMSMQEYADNQRLMFEDVKNDGFENGGFEVLKSRSRVTPTEKPTVSRDKSNHELEEMINSLQSQLNRIRPAVLDLNSKVFELRMNRLTQSHHDSTPHIRMEFDDIHDAPKVWVDGKRDYKYMDHHVVPILDTDTLCHG